MIPINNFDITETVLNDGTIAYKSISLQFNPISTNDKRVIVNDGNDYLVIKLGVDFVSLMNEATPPVFTLDGSAIPYEIKQNISEINPTSGTVQILNDPNGVFTGYYSSIFMSLADENKVLTATVYAPQSVLEAWVLNEVGEKLNTTILDNGNGTYNAEFENIKPISVNTNTDIFNFQFTGAEVTKTDNTADIIIPKTIALSETDTTADFLQNKLINQDNSIVFTTEMVDNVEKLIISTSESIQNTTQLLFDESLPQDDNYYLQYSNGVYSWKSSTTTVHNYQVTSVLNGNATLTTKKFTEVALGVLNLSYSIVPNVNLTAFSIQVTIDGQVNLDTNLNTKFAINAIDNNNTNNVLIVDMSVNGAIINFTFTGSLKSGDTYFINFDKRILEPSLTSSVRLAQNLAITDDGTLNAQVDSSDVFTTSTVANPSDVNVGQIQI